ncbi:hypothetical protein LINPERPRIM_LOCUS25565 [Linum perenne]
MPLLDQRCTLELEDLSIGPRSAGFSSADPIDCVAAGRRGLVHAQHGLF